MTKRIPWHIRAAACALLLLAASGSAEVSRVEIVSRGDLLGGRSFGPAGPYERIIGRVYFSINPSSKANRVIADLDKAPKNRSGRVEMSADLAILRPRDPAKRNGIALLDVVNRGNKMVLSSFNRARSAGDFSDEAEFGDGFLLRQGYTLVWVGWEFDVPPGDGKMRIEVPVAAGITGIVRGDFIPDKPASSFTVSDLVGYVPADASAVENTLTVRDGASGVPATIPRDKWSLSGNVVTLEGGCTPGRIYTLAYAAKNPPVAGLGFAAVRDTAAWVKYSEQAPARARYAIAFGSSQSGRFLRDFLYQGFNTDERGRQVFDGMLPHIAGASRLELNRRWATPVSLGMFTTTSYPFADRSQRDPATGVEEGALENPRAREHQPKVFYTNTSVEYWGGGRVAALIHATPDGSADLVPAANVRVYFLAGTQHGPGRFPPSASNAQQMANPNDYGWAMRALLAAMTRWVRDRVEPPPSRIPHLRDGTLAPAAKVAFPNLAGVSSPRTLSAGIRVANPLLPRDGAPGTPLPLLVPQVDRDGNEVAGIRLPEIAVPLATYTGWNFRKPENGAPDQLFPLLGSYVSLAVDKAERERTHDPRLAVKERYSSRENYLSRVQEAGATLVKDGYLLAEDLPAVVRRAGEHWDFLTAGKAP